MSEEGYSSAEEERSGNSENEGGTTRRGAKGPFTNAQREYIATYSKKWMEHLRSKKLSERELQSWRSKTIGEILESKLFKNKLDSSISKKQWRTVSTVLLILSFLIPGAPRRKLEPYSTTIETTKDE